VEQTLEPLIVSKLESTAENSCVSQSQKYLRIVSIGCAVITIGALAVLAVRAAMRLEIRWDTFMYHMPFAAQRAGIKVSSELSDYLKVFYEGYPALPHFIQGILWRLTGSINATGVINYLAFICLLIFCHTKLGARFWLVAMIALTAPMVLIHTTVSYIDLFGNCFLSIGIGTFVHMYLFDKSKERTLLLFGLAGLMLAAWSKYSMLPIALLFFPAFALLYWRTVSRAERQSGTLVIILVAVLLALTPYIKNYVLYGNPLWPARIAAFENYVVNFDEVTKIQRPPQLKDSSQTALFVHSLFEINHPTSYQKRARWIIDQGNATLAFRMGGLWNVSVTVCLITLAIMVLALDRRKGLHFIFGGIFVLGLISLLPQSHELRYYALFLPLCWALSIAMLFEPLSKKYPRSALGLLLMFAGMFLYMGYVNSIHYKIEKRGYLEAAQLWGAASWWEKLKPGPTYCVVDMVPLGFLMTGPTMSEFHIVEKDNIKSCPADSIIIVAGVMQAESIKKHAAKMMNVGLNLLYAKKDKEAAAQHFHEMLNQHPSHYGATFQLSLALDQAGRRGEARQYWEKMLHLAQQANDLQTLASVRARLDEKL